jgi:hypothetical protein
MSQICRFYANGHCNKGEQCNFIHEKTNDINVYDNRNIRPSKKKHNRQSTRTGYGIKNEQPVSDMERALYSGRRKKKRRPKNTESFEPSFKPPDMRIITEFASTEKYPRTHRSNDTIIVKGLFGKENDNSIYDKLLQEIKDSNINNDDLWKLWHGDTHLIVDDKKKWKQQCPTFNMVIDKLRHYFDVDVQATRFNLYENSKHWKPYHHDAAAIKKDKADKQNITIGVSFGLEREAAFEHATTRTVLSVPLPNGSIYIFNKDVNIEWKHGILQMSEPVIEKGRISIIVWGKVAMESK